MVSQERLVSAFLELADTLVADFDVIDFMDTLAHTSVELLGADAAGLMLADQRGGLHLIAASSEESRLVELFELQYDQGPCVDCYRQGRPVVNVSIEEGRRRWPHLGEAVASNGFSSVHALPMRLRDEVIGAMNLFLVSPGRLSEQDIALGQGLADMATIGLLQERSLRERDSLAEQLQGALNSRIMIEQAKGILAERQGLSMTAAFDAIRSYARRNRQPLSEVAAAIIDGPLDVAKLRQN